MFIDYDLKGENIIAVAANCRAFVLLFVVVHHGLLLRQRLSHSEMILDSFRPVALSLLSCACDDIPVATIVHFRDLFAVDRFIRFTVLRDLFQTFYSTSIVLLLYLLFFMYLQFFVWFLVHFQIFDEVCTYFHYVELFGRYEYRLS